MMKKVATTIITVAALGAGVATPVVPEQMEWTHSIETILFDTESGWIEQGQFSFKEDGSGYYVCNRDEDCAQEVVLHEEDLKFDTSGLTEVRIVGRQVFDFFRDQDTENIEKFQGDLTEYKKLQTVKDHPQPQKTIRKSLGSFFVGKADALIARDAVTTAGPNSNATSISWSHVTTSGGSDRFLMAFINTNDTSATDREVLIITYNGVRMSTTTARYGAATVGGAPFHLANPSTGSNTVSATLGGTTSTVIGVSITFTGIDQTNPFVTNAFNCATSGCTLTNASSTSWWLHHMVVNSNDLQSAEIDETCRATATRQWRIDTSSGALGTFGETCAPIIPNAYPTRSGIDAQQISNPVARAFELRNSSPVVTATSTNITYTTADIYGILFSLNGESAQDVFFNYGTASGVYTATTSMQYKNSVPQEITASLSGLSHSTTYYYRIGIQASSSALVYDTEGSFTTPCDPSLTTCTDVYTMETANVNLDTANTARRFGAWIAPTGVTSADVACWGGGGGGAVDGTNGGGAGGGGAYAASTVAVVAGTTYTIQIGAYGERNSASNVATSTFATTTVVADGGLGRSTSPTGGRGGLASLSTGSVVFDGGDGGNGDGTNDVGGGGGGAAGPDGAGNDGQSAAGGATTGADGGSGNNGSGGAAGVGGALDGTAGGASDLGGGGGGGSDTSGVGGAGGQYGGGGGGADVSTRYGTGNGRGGAGRCTVTYTAAGGGGTPSASSNLYIKNGNGFYIKNGNSFYIKQ